ncbi:unnamed protein product [Orchesella dallaii]|uniref:Uncharacterized protein n=1 Tax=Orchesella dallaii TaxID=48710 RepID=A0ABP1R4U7_9HEXA
MALDRTTVKLVYKGSDSINDKDTKKIINSAKEDLIGVFNNGVINSLLLVKFSSKDIFNDLEAEELESEVAKSVAFTNKFCSLLKGREDIPSALNLLLNLDNPNLDNYEKKIRKVFGTILPDLEVVNEPPTQNEPPPLPPRQLGVVIPQTPMQRQGTANDESDGHAQLNPDVQNMYN